MGMLISSVIVAYFLIAIWNTLLKEKSMVEEGGDPLPTSAYVFLTIKHVIWAVVAGFTAGLVPVQWFDPSILGALFMIAYVVLTYIASTAIEVLIRTVIVYIRVKAITKKTNTEDDEGA